VSWIDDRSAPLLVDLYELTMAASYLRHGMEEEATFDLSVRTLPEGRSFLLVCGLEQALRYLETLRFDEDAVAAVAALGIFDGAFLDRLRALRFGGEVWAMREGEVAFAGEPLLRVRAPLPEAQLVESFLLNALTFQTMVASKAARVALACRGRPFADFSLRRDHGPTAALLAARAAFVAGAASTSNVLAAARFGIPASGTMAHSYVMAMPGEREAFRRFARDFPGRATLLIDTYDTLAAARSAAEVARELAADGVGLRAVRIDSGDLGGDARRVRAILDEAGLPDVQIVLSGDLDEHRIEALLRDGVPVDAFGVGTRLGTSADAPSLGGVYKLADYGGTPRMKLSELKLTLPGRKQVWRELRDGRYARDVVALEGEEVAGARPLLAPVLEGGRRTAPAEPLPAARERAARSLAELPEPLRALGPGAAYPVEWSPGLVALVERTRRAAAGRGPAGRDPRSPAR
jgi:nicotinate phosphoribosyltransferase